MTQSFRELLITNFGLQSGGYTGSQGLPGFVGSAAVGSGTVAYATVAELPLSNNTTGSMAFVSATNRLYIWNGTGWFNIALINTSPTITAGPNASYTFAADGTPVVITLAATDPEGLAITWSSQVTSGSLGNTAVISQNANVFTITPSTSEADAGVFGVTFTASDGINLATAATSFTLAFEPDWTITTQQTKLVASDAQADDEFGITAISISGDTLAVGAYNEDTSADNAGAAYIFARSGTTWTQQAKLMASDAQASDRFGRSIALDGDTVVVGSIGIFQVSFGAAYIFARSGTTWAQQAKLVASDPAAGDRFGYSASIDGDTVVVGANNKNNSAGAAYIFVRSGTTWTQQAKLVSSDPGTSEYFGETVSIDGDTVAIGSPYDNPNGISSGAVYIFVRSGTTWTQQAKLVSSDAQGGDTFGYSVSVDGDTVVAGAYGVGPTYGAEDGAAYIFTRSGTTWTQQAKIQASDAGTGDRFGVAVEINGNTVAVGANYEDPSGVTDAGAAYIFARSGTTWTQQVKLAASDAGTGDWFGRSIAVDSNTVVVGAGFNDPGGASNAGAVYVFTATSSGLAIPPTIIGQAYGGGFYAGQISATGSGAATHYLVVAPRATGQTVAQWKTTADATDGAYSLFDGPTNSSNMNNANHPAAQFCEGLTIGGYSDWYMPSRDELNVCYLNLKPTAENGTQTSVAIFQSGGAEAFTSDGTGRIYWTSTGAAGGDATVQYFTSGTRISDNKTVTTNSVRAVRRIPI